jgi:hypothetical protein
MLMPMILGFTTIAVFALARHHQTQAIIAKRLGPVRMPDHAREPLHIGRKPRFTIV